AERGKGVEKLNEEQNKINEARLELEKLKDKGEEFTAEYDEQNRKLDIQQSKIDEARRKLEAVNEVAGKQIYKEVDVKTNPSIDAFNRSLSDTINKRVNLLMGDIRGP